MQNVVNPFGRENENVYLGKDLEQGITVEFNNNVVKGIGIVNGISSNSIPLMGKTYILEVLQITNMDNTPVDTEYSHISMQEFFIQEAVLVM